MNFIRITLASIVGLWLSDHYISGFGAPNELLPLVIAGAILSVLIVIAGSLIKLLTLPLIWLTAGLFKIVIYGFLIWVLAQFPFYVTFSGFVPLLWTTLLITFIVYIAKGFKL